MAIFGQGARDALLDSEERFRSLFEEAPVAYHEIDSTGVVVRVNRAECALLGFEASEIIGRPIWVFVAPEGREASREAIRQKIAGERPLVPFEREYIRRDGAMLILEIHENLIHDRAGHVVGIRTALLDATGRRHYQEQLREYSEELERKNQTLALALASAEEATELKSRFLANVSHEIRTPMNGVLGMTELLQATALDREQRRYVEMLRSSAEMLLAILNELLDFAKLEAGKLELESLPFDLGAVLEDVAAVLGSQAQEKGLELTCLVQPEVPRRLKGDPGRLRQIVTQLVGNAVKFTERGEVALRAELLHQTADRAVIRVTVEDTGVGIAPEFQARMFQSFTQQDASSTRRHGGVGLGLPICKHLVERMGGQIEVRSEPGRGTAVSFTAPFHQQPPQESAAAPVSLDGLRVLVVDDNATNRAILRRYLESWGCEVREAASAGQALDAMREASRCGEPFAIALIDMQMPGGDGAEAGQWIQADPRLRGTTLVSLTSAPMPGDAARLKEIGYAEYLQKPIRQSHLYNVLVEVLQQRSRPHPATETAPPPAPVARRHARLLVVEDNEVNRTIALRLLAKAGFQADAVSNGRQAVEAVAAGDYAVVLMDIQMPEMDGFEATAEIHRRLDPARCPPIIAMTANALEGDRERCLVAGMSDYVSKPVRLEELARAINRWVSTPGGELVSTEPLGTEPRG